MPELYPLIDPYVKVLEEYFRLVCQLWLERVEAKLQIFAEALDAWLHDLFQHPKPDWRERLDAFLSEQEAADRTVEPESRQELLAFLEGWAASVDWNAVSGAHATVSVTKDRDREPVKEPPSKGGIVATTGNALDLQGRPRYISPRRRPGGHHWVPRAAFSGYRDKMTKEALEILELGTKSTGPYKHGFDTWNGVKHSTYIDAMRELLGDWIGTRGGKLNEDGAKEFLSWIANGKCNRAAFAAKHKAAFATIFKWRKGFLQSIVVAHAAAEINPKLTAAELKAIAQQVVNGESTQPLSRAAAKAAGRVISGGKPLLKAAAKKILPGLVFFSAAVAAKRGWAGQGHTGDGAWGAFNEVTRDLVIADVVESIAFPTVLKTVDGLTNLLAPGLNAPGRKRYIRRGGRLIDLETGRIID